jgi:DNA/RNA endonuclease G (NUC1)
MGSRSSEQTPHATVVRVDSNTIQRISKRNSIEADNDIKHLRDASL